ncbi:MAG: methyltransferase domain-containing protein [Thermoflavifilum sp.]|nr:methyltransferase domain-containing protein [Thermoflavifilum sp.]
MSTLSPPLQPSYLLDEKFEYTRVADIKRLLFIRQALEQLPLYSRVLDVGCGNGVISRYLGRLGFQVLGIDVSEKAIEQARKLNVWSHVQFEVMDAEKLSVEAHQFDAIICSEVLEHLHHPDILLKHLKKLLKDNGKLIVTVPNGYGPRELFVTKPILHLRSRQGPAWRCIQSIKRFLGYQGTTVQSSAEDLDHVQFFTRKKLLQLAESEGFKITKWSKSNFIEDVFPISFFSKRFPLLQKIDCWLADLLPYFCTGGFLMLWEKKDKVVRDS